MTLPMVAVFTSDCRHCDRTVAHPTHVSGNSKIRWVRCKDCGTPQYCKRTPLTDLSSQTIDRINSLFDTVVINNHYGEDNA